METPECPVCLQAYDEVEAIPRVLPCGHTACSPCIAHLAASSSARPFPDAIRCPACNQIVPFPRGRGPDVLPKNIDLLRVCSPNSASRRPIESRLPERKRVDFLSVPWDDEFLSTWKDRILPFDAISMAEVAGTATEAVAATLTRASSCGLSGENQSVRLVTVGDSSSLSSSSLISTSSVCERFKLSYTARVMEALSKLGEKERVELGFIVEASLIQRNGLCRVFGLWMSPLEDSPLFLVCERFQFDLPCALNELEGHKMGLLSANETFSFAKVCMELCEVMIGLHSLGVVCGCLALSCFCFDGYGHCLLDLNEVLLTGRRVRKDVAEAKRRNSRCYLGKIQRFVSPELLTSLFSDHTASDVGNGIGYGSDVWSLACILAVLIVGDGQFSAELLEGTTDDDYVEFSSDMYNIWKEKVASILKASFLGTKLESLLPTLESCLSYDPVSRPSVNDVWRCIMSLFSKPHCTCSAGSDIPVSKRDLSCCLVLGDLCSPPEDGSHQLMPERNFLEGTERIIDDLSSLGLTGSGGGDVGHVQQETARWDLVKGFHGSALRSVSLRGHQDCITGLAVGGGFLFSSSFDKTVHVWSLEDLSLVQTLRGHEHRIMAVVFVDAIKPLCITGDSGGCIYAWGIDGLIEKVPLRKWHDHNDWRYTGVHSLAVSGSQHLYSGSGDKSIKAWSLQMWRNEVLLKSVQVENGALFAVEMDGKWLFTGGWDKVIQVQELSESESQVELRHVGSISCDSVVTSLLHWQGKLFAGSNKDIKVYHGRDTGDRSTSDTASPASLSHVTL